MKRFILRILGITFLSDECLFGLAIHGWHVRVSSLYMGTITITGTKAGREDQVVVALSPYVEDFAPVLNKLVELTQRADADKC